MAALLKRAGDTGFALLARRLQDVALLRPIWRVGSGTEATVGIRKIQPIPCIKTFEEHEFAANF